MHSGLLNKDTRVLIQYGVLYCIITWCQEWDCLYAPSLALTPSSDGIYEFLIQTYTLDDL